ncbi:trypsin-like peptidase domain-containing protein [Candidatus Sneabacter namystus]|uniref:PDZ domain-containing protein n=1 Tax=Candidatus Sneabacter namystus TaxID=2601646 RepID=A0A5C0UI41_9RICK|nr:trypsin-like peptidase domain-containing protein [Candidatus Sneabacter namystus]QEK39429.1 PDZ domain-containing protein [Candidatus Sneabacter namystus]
MRYTLLSLLGALALSVYSAQGTPPLNNHTIIKKNVATGNAFCNLPDIIEPLLPSVVNIHVVQENTRNPRLSSGARDPMQELLERFFGYDAPTEEMLPEVKSLGSGFIVSTIGHIVTNYHVIKGGTKIMVKMSTCAKSVKAKLVGFDEKTDIAILKIDTKKPLPTVSFGDSRKLRVGETVILVGNPLGLGETVTCGIVSNKARKDLDLGSASMIHELIQTDAAMNRGNSGGPMFNLEGKVVGVNCAICSPSGVSAGIGLALPSSYAKDVVDQIIKTGRVQRGRLSITLAPITEEVAEGIGIKELQGVLVADVTKGGAGDKAGLKAGDVITKFDNIAVKGTKHMQSLTANAIPGSVVKITIIRNGLSKDIIAKISADIDINSKDGQLSATGILEHNGVTLADLTNSIKRNLGIPESVSGVLVQQVNPSSPWANILKKEDIIVSVIGVDTVHDVQHWQKLYSDAKSKGRKWIALLIKRKGGHFSFAIKLPIL